jgi:acyl-CoA thioester hydrolase
MMYSTVSKIRVRYADTDQMKMAYYGNYFAYFEQGRSDLLREIGLPYSEIEHMGFYLPVAEAHARYLRPARYDDLLVVTTICKELPQARIRIDYEVRVDNLPDLIAEGYTVHSFVNAVTGKPTRVPQRFLAALTEAFHQSASHTLA